MRSKKKEEVEVELFLSHKKGCKGWNPNCKCFRREELLSHQFIAAFEVGDKKPSEMTDEELEDWLDVMADKLIEAVTPHLEAE